MAFYLTHRNKYIQQILRHDIHEKSLPSSILEVPFGPSPPWRPQSAVASHVVVAPWQRRAVPVRSEPPPGSWRIFTKENQDGPDNLFWEMMDSQHVNLFLKAIQAQTRHRQHPWKQFCCIKVSTKRSSQVLFDWTVSSFLERKSPPNHLSNQKRWMLKPSYLQHLHNNPILVSPVVDGHVSM